MHDGWIGRAGVLLYILGLSVLLLEGVGEIDLRFTSPEASRNDPAP
jgi:hypothetical protein